MKELLVVGVGGFVGAISRYALGHAVHRWLGESAGFPYGTLAVNVLGCLLIGAAMAFNDAGDMRPETRLLIATGFLGSLTTFSTFGHETLELVAVGRGGAAFGNVALNLIVGLLAVWIGRGLARPFLG